MNEPVVVDILEYQDSENKYEIEDYDVKLMLEEAEALNAQYLVDAT